MIGIDPGLNGAIAFLDQNGEHIEDLPTMGDGKHREIDCRNLFLLLEPHQGEPVTLERVASMPGQGVASMFKFGRVVGSIEGVLAACGCPVRYVTPQTWKKCFSLPREKDAARMRAIQLFPSLAPVLSRKKDDGRAEALLIALYGKSKSRVDAFFGQN